MRCTLIVCVGVESCYPRGAAGAPPAREENTDLHCLLPPQRPNVADWLLRCFACPLPLPLLLLLQCWGSLSISISRR